MHYSDCLLFEHLINLRLHYMTFTRSALSELCVGSPRLINALGFAVSASLST